MTSSRFRKEAHCACPLSIGHGTARPYVQLSPQIAQEMPALVAVRRAFITRYTVRRLAASLRPISGLVPTAPKSP